MTQVSPHMLLYGRNLRDIIDFKLAREHLDDLDTAEERKKRNHEKYVIIMKDNYDVDKYGDNWKVGDLVAYYIGERTGQHSRKLRKRFSGPWKVIERIKDRNNVVVKIQNEKTGNTLCCHVSMLKKYYPEGFVPLLKVRESERIKIQKKYEFELLQRKLGEKNKSKVRKLERRLTRLTKLSNKEYQQSGRAISDDST